MEENTDNNKIIDNSNVPEYLEFQYNFINIPWDDRSNRSKIGIVALLFAIFAVTMACVINIFFMHYKGFTGIKSYNNSETSCFKVRMDGYPSVARIHSVKSQQLLCVGAVVSSTSVLANGMCIKSGPIRMYVGSILDHRCKKGFSVDVIESVYHDGVVSKRLVLLSSYENIDVCSKVIRIGQKLDWNAPVHIIGRPFLTGRYLSRQHVNLAKKEIGFSGGPETLNLNNTICVKDLARCPVRTGDLMMQGGKLFGVAATSVHRNKVACFADLDLVKRDLKETDAEIEI